MMGNLVITIGRECGSAGRLIGQKLAADLGVKCYDKELLTLAAKNSGLCEELFKTHDEKPTSSFLYSLVMDTYSLGYNTSAYMDMPINHKIFLAQFDTIKKLAEDGLGVTFAYEEAVKEEIRQGKLCQLPISQYRQRLYLRRRGG